MAQNGWSAAFKDWEMANQRKFWNNHSQLIREGPQRSFCGDCHIRLSSTRNTITSRHIFGSTDHEKLREAISVIGGKARNNKNVHRSRLWTVEKGLHIQITGIHQSQRNTHGKKDQNNKVCILKRKDGQGDPRGIQVTLRNGRTWANQDWSRNGTRTFCLKTWVQSSQGLRETVL